MLLEVGRDVTQEFDTMYDISAWSHGYLWEATVNRLAQGTLDARALRPVSAASPSGSVAPGNLRTYGLVATSVAGIQAVNFLLDNGVAVSRTPDGMFAVPGSARPLVREAADTYGVAFTNLPPAQGQDATPVSKLRVGSAPRSTRCSPSPGWASTSRPSRTPASTTAATSPATSTRSSSRRRRSTRYPRRHAAGGAGHWVGQEAAAGRAVVVSGQARGANVTLFGTEPLYRTHPEGLYEQVANALWWKG
jgi:hypothetical protein